MPEPTRKQIEKFVAIRNRSGFNSNLQFQIDAKEAGFKVADLPQVEKTDEGIYLWPFSFGLLVECGGRLFLSDAPYDREYVIGQAMRLAFD